MKRTRKTNTLASEMKKATKRRTTATVSFEGNSDKLISTGSTLLDLAISGGRFHGGGIPAGILVEIFGPSGCGKTVLLSEIAGNVQRLGGDILFNDPEARLNEQFAQLFNLKLSDLKYGTPNTVTEVFQGIRKWQPKSKEINGIFTDSLAALSTDLEMGSEDGDKMGSRRAKEFSEELRRTCRLLQEKDYLMVCSNQIRENINTVGFGEKYTTPGGKAVGFYSSLRLRAKQVIKLTEQKSIKGQTIKRVKGVQTTFEVYKSSIWKPYRDATLTILFDYGIDDIRENLQFLKKYKKQTMYMLGERKLDKSIEAAIQIIESKPKYVSQLKEEVIALWLEIESKFHVERQPKIR